MTRDYRDLVVWQQAMELCESVYLLLRKFPAEEKYALCDQLRRAVVSIPSNIAEGNGRGSKSEYARFLAIARGSLFEVRTQLELSERLRYVKVQQGYMMMFSGAMSALRNPKAYENLVISRDDAIRKLIFASILMYKLDSAHFADSTNR